MIDFNLQPLSPSWKSGGGTKSSITLFLFGSSCNQPWSLGTFQKSPSWTNPLVVERTLLGITNKTPVSPFWLWSGFRKWGQESEYFDKRCSNCSYRWGNPKDFGSCEPGTGVNMYEKYMLCIWMAKYVFRINHNVTILTVVLPLDSHWNDLLQSCSWSLRELGC